MGVTSAHGAQRQSKGQAHCHADGAFNSKQQQQSGGKQNRDTAEAPRRSDCGGAKHPAGQDSQSKRVNDEHRQSIDTGVHQAVAGSEQNGEQHQADRISRYKSHRYSPIRGRTLDRLVRWHRQPHQIKNAETPGPGFYIAPIRGRTLARPTKSRTPRPQCRVFTLLPFAAGLSIGLPGGIARPTKSRTRGLPCLALTLGKLKHNVTWFSCSIFAEAIRAS